MIEETEELKCPQCGEILRHSEFAFSMIWFCDNCRSMWGTAELVEEMRDAAQAQPPRPESNFL